MKHPNDIENLTKNQSENIEDEQSIHYLLEKRIKDILRNRGTGELQLVPHLIDSLLNLKQENLSKQSLDPKRISTIAAKTSY